MQHVFRDYEETIKKTPKDFEVMQKKFVEADTALKRKKAQTKLFAHFSFAKKIT